MFNPKQIIKSLKQLEQVANEYLPNGCKVSVDPVTRGHGERADHTRVIKLIVGWKLNPVYDPTINPDTKNVADINKATARVADVRTIALPPRINVKELIDVHLTKIKKSLLTRDKSIDSMITTIEKPKTEAILPTDNELAKELSKGEDSDHLDQAGEGWEDEEDDDKDKDVGESTLLENVPEPPEPESESLPPAPEPDKLDQVMDALTTIGDNQQVISQDLKKFDNRLKKAEKKIKAKAKGKGNTKIKKEEPPTPE